MADKVWFVRKALALLTEPFTLRQAQQLYEALRGEEVDAANFRRDVRATGLLEDTGSLRSEGPGRPGSAVPARLGAAKESAKRVPRPGFCVGVRSIVLAFALVLVLPASALAAGTLTVSISGAGGVAGERDRVHESSRRRRTRGPARPEAPHLRRSPPRPRPASRFDGWTGACAAPACVRGRHGR